MDWINGTLFGSLAIGLSVIAVAIVGFIMLSGRFPVRRGLQVIVGCFILLGAPVIAASFTGLWQDTGAPPEALPTTAAAELSKPRADLPPAQYDPYAGASLRSD